MKLPTKTIEKSLFKSGYGLIYAVDEVGMGCLAGPVVVCAIGITNTFYKNHHKKLKWLKESKLLSSQQRDKFAKELLTENLAYALSYARPKTIDKLNIYQASRLAMRNAIKKIKPEFDVKSILLVDGNKKIPKFKGEQMAVVKGDRKIFAIACASIIAKVYRDKMMARYAKKYPGYGFEKHKGYGTKYHQASLASLGPSAIHRMSFRLKY